MANQSGFPRIHVLSREDKETLEWYIFQLKLKSPSKWHSFTGDIILHQELIWHGSLEIKKYMNGVLRFMCSLNDHYIIQRIFFPLRREMWENTCVFPVFPKGIYDLTESGKMRENNCMLLSWGKLYFKRLKAFIYPYTLVYHNVFVNWLYIKPS